jgi:arsenate reductase (glutaredoxin)
MPPTVWAYAGCGTCKKAERWLRAHGVAVDLRPIVEAPPSAETLRALWQKSGLPLQRFFNTSGQSYRQGGFQARLPGMSEDAQLAALAADGKLIRRPLLDAGDTALVGFDEAAWAGALLRG